MIRARAKTVVVIPAEYLGPLASINTGIFSFRIKDIYVFSELGENLFKFRNLKNLNVSILFSSLNKVENIKLLKGLGFIFKEK